MLYVVYYGCVIGVEFVCFVCSEILWFFFIVYNCFDIILNKIFGFSIVEKDEFIISLIFLFDLVGLRFFNDNVEKFVVDIIWYLCDFFKVVVWVFFFVCFDDFEDMEVEGFF